MNLVRGGRTAASCGGLRSVNILMQENICDELLKHQTVDQLREHGLLNNATDTFLVFALFVT
jgi:hypothetical protein